ncbi:MAG: NAD(P)H-binding protein [Planctomycetota bacterium]|jgi:nucleoside-diphosphate-sugar epimerase
MKRTVIIGCGYVGEAVAKVLLERGHHVVGTVTTSERQQQLSARGVEANVVQLPECRHLETILAGCDALLFSAGPGRNGDYRALFRHGAARIVQAARTVGLTRMLFTSSTRVYGHEDGSWVDESSETSLCDEKGTELLAAETAFLEGVTALPFRATAAVLRLGGIHGPGRELRARIIRSAGASLPGGQAFVNLVHLNDIVHVIAGMIERDEYGVFNVVGDTHVTRRELYDSILRNENLDPVHWTEEDSSRPRFGKRVKNERIRKLLGMTFRDLPLP